MDLQFLLHSDIYTQPAFTVLFQLAFAMFLGMLLGIERNMAHQAAGMRVFGLVSMGACLFVLTAIQSVAMFGDVTNTDVLRAVSGVISGVGFIGAGVIIFKDSSLRGLTTAAGLWVAAGIGIAVAFNFYLLATVGTGLTLLAFTFFWRIEEKIKHMVPEGMEDRDSGSVE